MNFILIAVIVLGAIGLIAAIVLFAASKKFAVYEDPRIAQVGELLPGANCGGCGFPGCSGMADALVKGADVGSIDGLSCPVGGAEVMDQVTAILFSEDAGAPAESAPAAGGDAPKKPAGPLKPMSTDLKPFVEPKGLDFSGPKANPVPTIPAGLKPAKLPEGWPASA